MKKLFLVFVLTGLLTMIASAQDTGVKPKIQQLNNQMADALIKGNPDLLSDMYSDDVISLPSYMPMTKGKKEMLNNMKKDFEKGNKIKSAKFTTTDIKESGNFVVEIGTYDMVIDMAKSDEDITDKGKYVTVWEKNGNNLKILVETWNTDTNPWEGMEHKDHMDQKNKEDVK